MGDTTATRIARDCLAVRVRLLNRVVTRVYDDALRPHGLTTAQVNILAALSVKGPVRATEIAAALELEKSTLSRNLARLGDRGLVARQGPLLRVTRKGTRLLEKAEPAWEAAQREAGRLLGAAGARNVRTLASRVSGL